MPKAIITTLRWLLRRGSPLPIPNREVKPACADGTAVMWESMSSPFFEKPIWKDRLFCFIGTTCSQARFVAFASTVWLKPRVFKNPVSSQTGFFVFYSSVTPVGHCEVRSNQKGRGCRTWSCWRENLFSLQAMQRNVHYFVNLN